jgi:hypothetical protein
MSAISAVDRRSGVARGLGLATHRSLEGSVERSFERAIASGALVIASVFRASFLSARRAVDVK